MGCTGDVSQQLRSAYCSCNSVPSTHVRKPTTTCNSMGSNTLFWPLWSAAHAQTILSHKFKPWVCLVSIKSKFNHWFALCVCHTCAFVGQKLMLCVFYRLPPYFIFLKLFCAYAFLYTICPCNATGGQQRGHQIHWSWSYR